MQDSTDPPQDTAWAGSVTAPVAPVILAAEDDPAFRRLLVSMLEQTGYRVQEARNGMEVLDRLGPVEPASGDTPPDLLITDVRMPGLSGLRLLAALRQTGRTIPVVVITAFGSPETHATARALGAAAVFDKPFDLGDLRREVARQLPTRGRR